MPFIDLRSDTVTHPTESMRAAMSRAEVGDDVYGEDPTVNRLQNMAAAMLGKEAALFVSSGTMGNLASVLAHCNRGDEIILGNLSHIFISEAGGIAALGGVHPRPLPNDADGSLDLAEVEAAVRGEDIHYPVTRLIALENTHNRCLGAALSPQYGRAVAKLARRYGLATHLDGARIFNAAAGLDVPVQELSEPFDSISFCLSKALGAPVGSLICGSGEFIRRAHRIRKQLGGGMRQAGILAAAGIVALQEMVDRLSEDHARARLLAREMAALPGLHIEAEPLTNMVYFSLDDEVPLSTDAFSDAMKDRNVLFKSVGQRRYRLVIHYMIDDQAIEQVVLAFQQQLKVLQIS